MSDPIGPRIAALKTEFSDILFLKQETVLLFEKSKEKIKKLQEWYNSYIDENHNHLFIFGLDAFHYQGKIIDVEYDDMKRLYQSITNRIYCEYYKLYQIIVKYTEQVVKDKKVTDVVNSNNNFPKYHDLEPYKQYGTETITQLHDVIMLLFTSVKNVIDKKHEELDLHRAKNRIGINIDNFIQAFHFEIMIMEQKLMLFISYMEFFHKMNIKYLKRFTSKMNLFTSQIDHDIRIDSNTKTKERRKTMIEEFKQDNINVGLLNELAESIASTSDEETTNQEPNDKKKGERSSFHDENLPEPPTIIRTDNKQEHFVDDFKNKEIDTYEDETNTTQDDETDLNIRKRFSSIKSNYEHEKKCNYDQETNQSVASQILFGVDEPESPRIVGDLTRSEFSLNSLPGEDTPNMDSKEHADEEQNNNLTYRVIYEHGTFIRDTPSKDAASLGDLDYGDTIEVTGKMKVEDPGLTYMELANGKGWVPVISKTGDKVIESEAEPVVEPEQVNQEQENSEEQVDQEEGVTFEVQE